MDGWNLSLIIISQERINAQTTSPLKRNLNHKNYIENIKNISNRWSGGDQTQEPENQCLIFFYNNKKNPHTKKKVIHIYGSNE